MAEPTALKYRAFISYSHADTAWAKWLHRALESFRIDKDSVGPETASSTIPSALRPIFRDRDDFTAGHTLTDQTLAALDASRALIVICSPAAAKSHYVNEEIRLFKARHSERFIIPLIVDGKPGDQEAECFPPSLNYMLDGDGNITNEPVALLAADAREEGDGKNLALAKVVAGLLGVSSDDIFRRSERERRRKQRNWITGLSAVAILLAGLAVFAEFNRREAVEQRAEAERSFAVAKQSANALIFDIARAARQHGISTETVNSLLSSAEDAIGDLVEQVRAANYDQDKQSSPALSEMLALQATMLDEFAKVYAAQGDMNKQKAALDRALYNIIEVTSANPDNVAFERRRAYFYRRLGDLMMAKGDIGEATKTFGVSRGILDRLVRWAGEDAEGVQDDLAVTYGKEGDAELARGNIDGAQEAYRKKAEILKRAPKPLVQPDIIVDEAGLHASLIVEGGREVAPVSKEADLFASQLEIGNILMAKGDTVGALEAYQGSVPIMEQMAKVNPGNVVWQLNLSIAHNSIGDVFAAQNKLDEAVKWYRDSLAIRERLTDIDPSNANWQYALTVSLGRVGDVLKKQGKQLEALAVYEKALAIDDRLLQVDPKNVLWQTSLSDDANDVAGVSYRLVLAGEFTKALEASDHAIAAIPDTIWPYINRAHALMFLGREDEARALYLKYRGTQKAQGDRTWNDIVRVDFAEMRQAGHTHPLMDEIETALGEAAIAEPIQPDPAARQ